MRLYRISEEDYIDLDSIIRIRVFSEHDPSDAEIYFVGGQFMLCTKEEADKVIEKLFVQHV